MLGSDPAPHPTRLQSKWVDLSPAGRGGGTGAPGHASGPAGHPHLATSLHSAPEEYCACCYSRPIGWLDDPHLETTHSEGPAGRGEINVACQIQGNDFKGVRPVRQATEWYLGL